VRRRTRDALIPPKPKELDRQILAFCSRPLPGDVVEVALIAAVVEIQSGRDPAALQGEAAEAASMAPEAPEAWAWYGFAGGDGDVVGVLAEHVLMAAVSVASLSGVDEPWGLMKSTSRGARRRSEGERMARAAWARRAGARPCGTASLVVP
jgi:hypothetical protein